MIYTQRRVKHVLWIAIYWNCCKNALQRWICLFQSGCFSFSVTVDRLGYHFTSLRSSYLIYEPRPNFPCPSCNPCSSCCSLMTVQPKRVPPVFSTSLVLALVSSSRISLFLFPKSIKSVFGFAWSPWKKIFRPRISVVPELSTPSWIALSISLPG